MLHRRFPIVVLSATLAVTAWAGEIRLPVWPRRSVPLEVTSIPVVMDIAFWIRIRYPGPIKLHQQSLRTYSGCTNLEVDTNMNVRLSCSVTATGIVPGVYSCSLTPADVDAPGAPPYPQPTLCVTLRDADLRGVPGGLPNVHVATVIVRVIPRP